MKVYLAKFTKNGKVAYKIGHTKWFYPIKRFQEEEYNVFDKVEILADINIQHTDPVIARFATELVEVTLHAVFPKNFRLEEHFMTEQNVFDGLSGITEMFISECAEVDIVDLFKDAKTNVDRVIRKYNGK